MLVVLLFERLVLFEMVQLLVWQFFGVLVWLIVEFSVIFIIGGRYLGLKVEVMYLLMEKFSWGCGCVQLVDFKVFVFVLVGWLKRNGE